ncbi:hypothetical protein A8V01_13745 [Novosphingobium guangzhouense]|uniref:Uncharacterized protein n=1 Tax=Novosphingobium guangzhouense TaxID=1850347 RepID=A0A2K2G497_9SPHN|nr:hypothetical protein A8V01_13745 [Novosphingobium guangzhouense]
MHVCYKGEVAQLCKLAGMMPNIATDAIGFMDNQGCATIACADGRVNLAMKSDIAVVVNVELSCLAAARITHYRISFSNLCS